MVNKILITTAFVVLGSLLAACITSVDSALPYAQLPEITVATQVTLVAPGEAQQMDLPMAGYPIRR